jgi:uncharacterized membrane protein
VTAIESNEYHRAWLKQSRPAPHLEVAASAERGLGAPGLVRILLDRTSWQHRRTVQMAELSTRQRDKLSRRDFAYVDAEGGEHLPIHDAAHVRNALARFNQTEFESNAAKERARKKILAAARKFDIEVDDDDNVRHAS